MLSTGAAAAAAVGGPAAVVVLVVLAVLCTGTRKQRNERRQFGSADERFQHIPQVAVESLDEEPASPIEEIGSRFGRRRTPEHPRIEEEPLDDGTQHLTNNWTSPRSEQSHFDGPENMTGELDLPPLAGRVASMRSTRSVPVHEFVQLHSQSAPSFPDAAPAADDSSLVAASRTIAIAIV